MTDMTEAEKAAARDDCRRAAALVTHHSRADIDGINAVLQEAAEANRVTPLFLALLDLYAVVLPELRTESAIALLGRWVTDIAARPL